MQTNTPVLLLQETDGEGRTLPIFIGNPEATAIAYAIQGVEMPRPLTHDLMKDMLGALEIKVEQVLITELRSSTYFAELHLRRGERAHHRLQPALRRGRRWRCGPRRRSSWPTS